MPRFRPGQSGNPAGRRPGTKSTATVLRAQIAEAVPEIIVKLKEAAKAGDVGAARLLLERVLPPVRASEEAVPFTLPDGSLTDQGRAVLAAAGAGDLGPGQAQQLLSALAGLAKLVETDELARRLAALEEKHGNS